MFRIDESTAMGNIDQPNIDLNRFGQKPIRWRSLTLLGQRQTSILYHTRHSAHKLTHPVHHTNGSCGLDICYSISLNAVRCLRLSGLDCDANWFPLQSLIWYAPIFQTDISIDFTNSDFTARLSVDFPPICDWRASRFGTHFRATEVNRSINAKANDAFRQPIPYANSLLQHVRGVRQRDGQFPNYFLIIRRQWKYKFPLPLWRVTSRDWCNRKFTIHSAQKHSSISISQLILSTARIAFNECINDRTWSIRIEFKKPITKSIKCQTPFFFNEHQLN